MGVKMDEKTKNLIQKCKNAQGWIANERTPAAQAAFRELTAGLLQFDKPVEPPAKDKKREKKQEIKFSHNSDS